MKSLLQKTTNELGEDDKKIDICNGCTDVLESQACITGTYTISWILVNQRSCFLKNLRENLMCSMFCADKFLEDSVKALEDPNENVMVVSLANVSIRSEKYLSWAISVL